MNELRKFAANIIWNRGNAKTKNVYRFPLPTDKNFTEAAAVLAVGTPENELYRIGHFLACTSPHSHIGPFKWAVDFLVPDGTEILASKEGQVIEAVDNFKVWGPTEEFRDKLNYLTIQHCKGEYSQYCHLAPSSFQNTGLKIGDCVTKGQIIARVGKTGWTDRDHLHFIVFRLDKLRGNPYGFYSLHIQFETL